jgi:hypothetical protein
MKQGYILEFAVFAITLGMLVQNDVPTIKVEVTSAFVWGEDTATGAVSSTIQDPLTGNAIRKLSAEGVEVSSQMGFERVSSNEVGTFLNYTTTVVNGTDSKLSVRYGGISVDGHTASPLRVVPPGRKLNKNERKGSQDMAELGEMHCFTSRFLSSDNFFSANTLSQALIVAPRTALTVSAVIKDPRSYHSVLCSVAGCYPTGTIRYYVRVGAHDYVFVWPGRSAVYCGK